jgi:hypothetical protein
MRSLPSAIDDPGLLGRPDLHARVRVALVRRDRVRLADAVATAIEHARTAPAPGPCSTASVADQVLLATPVLRSIEQLLRGDGLLDTRGVHLVGGLLDDLRTGRTAPGDPLAVDEAAREARRALHPHRRP